MGKFIKKIRHGMHHLSEGSQQLIHHDLKKRKYSKPFDPVKLPRNVREATSRDMEKIGRDIYSALDRINVR